MNILITGCCGFIGFSLAKDFLKKKENRVLGIDDIDNYYDVKLKLNRLKELKKNKKFIFKKINIKNSLKIDDFFKRNKLDAIFHFAAQAGVRYSFINPTKYLDSNINGFFNILESARKFKIKKIIIASSSSVYGDVKKLPVLEKYHSNEKNLYAVSKSFNEKLSQIYSNKYKMKIYCMRFFTVYGEWGRPDMFMMKYANASKDNKVFTLYNFGKHRRDFTYIKDVTYFLKKILNKKIKSNFDIFNICSSRPVSLPKVINELNKFFKKPKILMKQRDDADVLHTHGSNKKLLNTFGHYKFTSLKDGIANLANWYIKYYKLKKKIE